MGQMAQKRKRYKERKRAKKNEANACADFLSNFLLGWAAGICTITITITIC